MIRNNGISSKEIEKVIHEINNVYFVKYQNKKFCIHRTIDIHNHYCLYYFENYGFDNYVFIDKIYDDEEE